MAPDAGIGNAGVGDAGPVEAGQGAAGLGAAVQGAAATKPARQQLIHEYIRRESVRSQSELVAYLAHHDIQVTQATLSRDLVELGAVKVRDAEGLLTYAIPEMSLGHWGFSPEAHANRLTRLCEELLLSAQASANIAVLRTPPGAAQLLASAIDAAGLNDTIGTIAGDDTIMVISQSAQGGQQVADTFLAMAQRAPSSEHGSEKEQ